MDCYVEIPETTEGCSLKTNRVEMEAVEALVRRIEVMECLLKRPLEKSDIVDALDVSRSTVDRAVRDLETYGFIIYSDGKYTTTTLGELAATQLFELIATVDVGMGLEPALQWVPADEFDLELQHLADADLYVPEPNNPYAMVNRHVNVLKETEQHRMVLPLIGLHGMEAEYETVVENGVESTSVVTPGVAETLQSNPDYTPLFEEMAPLERYEVYVYDGEIPFFVGVLDEIVQIGVDEEGEPRALVETDTTEVRSWAKDLFEEYKSQAEQLV